MLAEVVDPWLQHQESRQRFEEDVFDRQGLYPVEIVTDSYIERTRLFLRGVGRRHAVRVIGSEPEFAECADLSRVRFVWVTGYRYLGPHLRRRPGLKLVQDEYQLLDGTTVARWDQPTSSHIHHESFRLHPLLIQDELMYRHQLGLLCIDSFRFSERQHHELGLQLGGTTFAGHNFIYKLHVGEQGACASVGRPRMHTYVHIIGKRLLTRLGSRTFCRVCEDSEM